ncbi:ATP-binding cassette domain-containing protein [Aliiroseovarius sp. S1339]|uniref:ATP-binding cassette domain-containing protein n=1 Tax=Aliiroseovarius sp. S1339 TaxID=2936990 RepID=UPI0020C03128|nr:ATP-binding cassette domain-containing protein [Aliiroseovarius sp. S1339]MCK8464709.1 ATP-binding cassette domain-containing protein [Aliiroseovarius sp. S1339]
MVSKLFPLVVEGASVRRGRKVLVGPVDLIQEGQGVTIVIGPNGAGKTSLLRMLHGIARLGSGSINWACDDIEARRRQAFVFQSPIIMRRSVLGNLAYPLRLTGMSRTDANARATAAAHEVGLGDMLARPAPFLSGGERQKLALARALITKPELLFLDEPCASLDGRATREIEAILIRTSAAGTRLIMSTHDMGQARRLATEVLFLLNGKIHEHGSAEQFFAGPETAQANAFLKGDIVE